MEKKNFFWIATIFGCFIFQMVSSDFLSFAGAFPNFLLLSTIFFAINFGPSKGQWVGFVWGLLADVSSSSIFGSQTFMLTLIGYLSGKLQGKVDEEKPIAQMTIVILMSILYIMGLMFFESLFAGSIQRYKGKLSFIQPAYSTLLSPIFFWVLHRWCGWFGELDQ